MVVALLPTNTALVPDGTGASAFAVLVLLVGVLAILWAGASASARLLRRAHVAGRAAPTSAPGRRPPSLRTGTPPAVFEDDEERMFAEVDRCLADPVLRVQVRRRLENRRRRKQ